MKKHYLDNEFEEDFVLFGVVSSERPHRLAWLLNSGMHCGFERKDDILFYSKEQLESYFPRYDYSDDINRLQYHLLGNKDEGQCLLPELKHVDYILMIKGAIEYFKPEKFIATVKTLESVQLITPLNSSILKSKHNLIIPD